MFNFLFKYVGGTKVCVYRYADNSIKNGKMLLLCMQFSKIYILSHITSQFTFFNFQFQKTVVLLNVTNNNKLKLKITYDGKFVRRNNVK